MLKELFLKYKLADPLFKLIYINLLVFILVQICNTSSFLFQSALFDLVFWFCYCNLVLVFYHLPDPFGLVLPLTVLDLTGLLDLLLCAQRFH